MTKEKPIPRKEYFRKLVSMRDRTEIVKVITGIRRCGKSTIMEQFREYLASEGVPDTNIVAINFEFTGFLTVRTKEELLSLLIGRLAPSGTTYFLLDEIQNVEGWETVINAVRAEFDVSIYVTGSNSRILSGSLSTNLTGRFFEIRMLPMSLGEFMDLNEMSDPKAALRKYMTRGSLPVIHRDYTDADAREMLRDLFNSILFKDILYASDIRDPVLLENIAMYLLDNIGNTVSPASISRYTGKDAGMIDRYLKLITGSYLFHRVDSYDLRGRKLLKTQAKYYCADIGIRHALLGEQYGDTGRIMENLVFLELIRRGYEVRVGKYGDREIDFAARKGADTIYYQVTMSLAAEYNLKREMEPFSAPKDHHRRVLITGDDVVKSSENGVEIVGLCDFLLGLD